MNPYSMYQGTLTTAIFWLPRTYSTVLSTAARWL